LVFYGGTAGKGRVQEVRVAWERHTAAEEGSKFQQTHAPEQLGCLRGLLLEHSLGGAGREGEVQVGGASGLKGAAAAGAGEPLVAARFGGGVGG